MTQSKTLPGSIRPSRMSGSRDVDRAEEPAVHARRLEPFAAEDAGAVGEGERHDDEISGPDGVHVVADRVDDADRLVTHHAAGLARLHRVVGPEVAAADA